MNAVLACDLLEDSLNNRRQRIGHGNHDRIGRFLQRGKLAVEQVGWHKMIPPPLHPFEEQFLGALKVNET